MQNCEVINYLYNYPKSLMTPPELSDILGMSLHTLKKWRRQKRGPSYTKIAGHDVRYSPCVVADWLVQAEVDHG